MHYRLMQSLRNFCSASSWSHFHSLTWKRSPTGRRRKVFLTIKLQIIAPCSWLHFSPFMGSRNINSDLHLWEKFLNTKRARRGKKKCKTARCTLNLQIYSKVANERAIKNFEEWYVLCIGDVQSFCLLPKYPLSSYSFIVSF